MSNATATPAAETRTIKLFGRDQVVSNGPISRKQIDTLEAHGQDVTGMDKFAAMDAIDVLVKAGKPSEAVQAELDRRRAARADYVANARTASRKAADTDRKADANRKPSATQIKMLNAAGIDIPGTYAEAYALCGPLVAVKA